MNISSLDSTFWDLKFRPKECLNNEGFFLTVGLTCDLFCARFFWGKQTHLGCEFLTLLTFMYTYGTVMAKWCWNIYLYYTFMHVENKNIYPWWRNLAAITGFWRLVLWWKSFWPQLDAWNLGWLDRRLVTNLHIFSNHLSQKNIYSHIHSSENTFFFALE